MVNTPSGQLQDAIRLATGAQGAFDCDWHALFDLYAIPAGAFDCRLLQYLNLVLITDYNNIPRAQIALASAQGVYNWPQITTPFVSIYNGRVVWYAFNEDTGNVVHDYGGSIGPITLSFTPTWVPGRLLSAIKFNGVDQYFSTPPGLFEGTPFLSLCAWIRPDILPGVGPSGIQVSVAFDASAGGGEVMWIGTKGNKVAISNSIVDTVGPAIKAGEWHQITVTLSGGVATGYCDGVQFGSMDFVIGSGDDCSLTVGEYATPGLGYAFNGGIDEVIYYNIALPQSEIGILANQIA